MKRWGLDNGDVVRILITTEGIIKAIAFENSGKYLISGSIPYIYLLLVDDLGDIMIFDISTATLVNKISRKECGSILSIDISQDDVILAIGYDNMKIELVDLQKLKADIDDMGMEPATSNTKNILASYRTKQSIIFCLKFTYENLLLAVSLFCPENR